VHAGLLEANRFQADALVNPTCAFSCKGWSIMNKPLIAVAAACFALMLAMPAHAEIRAKTAGLNSADTAAQTSEISSQRRYHRRYYGPRRAYWGPRRAYWGPRRAYWGPRRAYWGPPAYWGPRRVWWGPRYAWRPRPVYFAPAPVYWGPRAYWGGPVISVGFGPRWWW